MGKGIYLVGEEGKEMTVDCSVTRGTLPAAVTIYVNYVIVPSIAISVTKQRYKINLEAKHHLTQVMCLARNLAGEVSKNYSLYVKSKVLLILFIIN